MSRFSRSVVGVALVLACSTMFLAQTASVAEATGEAVQSTSSGSAADVSGKFHGLLPVRIFDSRSTGQTLDALQEGAGPVAGQVEVQVAGRAGVPTSGLGAVVLNVTVTGALNAGHVTVFANGEPQPTTSVLNFTRGSTVSNAVIAKVGEGGKVAIVTSAATQLVVDVSGWYPSDSDYVGVSPARLADTRTARPTVDGLESGSGSFSGVRKFQIAGRGGAPATGAGAVVLNVTSTGPVNDGYLTVFPSGAARPTASNLNFARGATVAAMVVAKVGADGTVSVFSSAKGDIVVDLMGWFPSDSDLAASTPARLVDTRPGRPTTDGLTSGGGPFSGNQAFSVVGRAGIPASGVGAVVLTVTVVDARSSGYTTVFPAGTVPGNASNVNHAPGRPVANTVIAKVGEDGKVTVFNSAAANVVIDVAGWMPAVGDDKSAVGSQLAVGSGHACVITADSGVSCWGWNDAGQLGDGTNVDSPRPVKVAGLSGVTQIAASYTSTCAVVAGGAVRCWGDNSTGQLGDIAVESWATPVRIRGISGVTEIAAGSAHTCVLSNQIVKCWGNNQAGQLGNGTTSDPDSESGKAVEVAGLTGVKDLSGGLTHTCAVLVDGSAKCWGTNPGGLTGVHPDDPGVGDYSSSSVPVAVRGVSDAESVAAGGVITCVTKVGGSADCWGYNQEGALGSDELSTFRTVAEVPGVSGVSAIGAGGNSVCALASDGRVTCWGSNSSGQLGNGTNTATHVPQGVIGISGAMELSSGPVSVCTLFEDRSVKCWGSNYHGSLGDGTTVDSNVPVDVLGL